MRVTKWLAVGVLLVLGLVLSVKAFDQFGKFQEFNDLYRTPFHAFNIAILVLWTVAVFVLLAYIASDRFDENEASLGGFIRDVLLATSGILLLGVANYEAEVNSGDTFPYIHAYNDLNITAVFLAGFTLLILALGYLFREAGDDSRERYRAPTGGPASAGNNGEADYRRPGIDIELTENSKDAEGGESDTTLIIRADYPDAELLDALVSLLLTQQFSHPDPLFGGLGGGIFGQPLGGSLFGSRGRVRVVDIDELIQLVRYAENLRKKLEGDKPSDDSPPPEPEAPKP